MKTGCRCRSTCSGSLFFCPTLYISPSLRSGRGGGFFFWNFSLLFFRISSASCPSGRYGVEGAGYTCRYFSPNFISHKGGDHLVWMLLVRLYLSELSPAAWMGLFFPFRRHTSVADFHLFQKSCKKGDDPGTSAVRYKKPHSALDQTEIYGIFQQRSRCTADSRDCPGRRPWRVGCGQFAGGLWQRQPCDTFLTEKVRH